MMIIKQKTIKRYFVALTIIIIPAFVLWGSQVLKVSFKPALKIYGKNISQSEFLKFYELTLLSLKLHMGEDFYSLNAPEIKAETIKRILLLTAAKRRKLKVKDQEIVEFIMEHFKRKGKFDKESYLQTVRRYFRTTPLKFEEMLRQDLLIHKLFKEITKNVSVSDDELLKVYRALKEKAKINFIKIDSTEFYKEVKSNPKELQEYFRSHREDFRIPPKVKIKYVFIPLKDKKTLSTLKRLKTLEHIRDFFGIPILESEYFSLDEPIPHIGWQRAINKTAFDLEKGQTSKPIFTEKGIYVIKLIGKKPSYLPEFKEVKEKVKEVLTKRKALKLAKLKAFKIYKKLKEGNSLNGVKIQTSDFFKRGDYIPNLGADEGFIEKVFNSPLNEWQKPYRLNSRFVIFKVVAKEGFSQKKFQEEKEKFREAYLKTKRIQTFEEFFASLLKRSNFKIMNL